VQGESVGSIFHSGGGVSGGVDFFGQALDAHPTAHQVEAQKAYMDEFQKIIGGPVSDSSMNSAVSGGFFAPSTMPAQTFQPGGGLDALGGSPSRGSIVTAPNLAASVLKPATVPDVNTTVLNQWNPMYTPLKTELPKPAPFFTPPMEVPRRRF
jgi:hypothetical protein